MSARSVCSGTRPSEYDSVRAISAPPRRPETWILQPFAPERMALVSARFMARRNATRFWRLLAADWPASAAAKPGGFNSRKLAFIDLQVNRLRSPRKGVAPEP